jgi:hypothetical protein
VARIGKKSLFTPGTHLSTISIVLKLYIVGLNSLFKLHGGDRCCGEIVTRSVAAGSAAHPGGIGSSQGLWLILQVI